ncbi:MAG: dipeptidase [Anaerolineales bacterium]|jgi:acetylornithine deacetylase/succinyl-diaminopimelate desuccinylase-like protein
MPDGRSKALEFAHQNRELFLEELIALSAIPSISTDTEFKSDVERTAVWVSEKFSSIGLENVRVFPTDGHPVVFAESPKVDGTPTVLIYGHYDVQPAEPLDKWESDPFQPQVRGDHLYARGATDMKGQVAATIDAVEAIVRTGNLPINVKFLIEGEEEIGSPHLGNFIRDHKELLACDFALNPDTGMVAPDLPTITYALRGLAYFEIRVFGPKHDLHSGVFGGAVHNPGQAICELIAGMHDKNGHITLPGFYDSVRPLSDEERAEIARLPKNEAWYLEHTGAPALWGEEKFSPDERVGGRPTLEVNGLFSGFIGEGSKTVLPAYAMAKISCRLVPDQHPDQVYEQLIQYMSENAPDSIRWEIIQMVGSPPSLSDRNSPWTQAYFQAAETVWGVKPAFKREGGSVPVVTDFQQTLGVDVVNMGFGLPTDNMHGPNEKLDLPTWYRGIDALIHFFFNVAENHDR